MACPPPRGSAIIASVTFTASFATRHTDSFASTGYVHAGVLLALTELAYAQVEQHVGVSKSPTIVAVERATRAVYRAPLPWQEGASIQVTTTEATDRGFTQEFMVRSQASGRQIASVVHDWVWLDTETGNAVALPKEVQERFLAS